MNNIVGGCNNRLNDLFRVELVCVLLSHKQNTVLIAKHLLSDV